MNTFLASRLRLESWVVALLLLAVATSIVSFSPHLLPGRLLRDDKDLTVYERRSTWVEQGTSPYRDTPQEYPIFGVLYISIPRVFTSTSEGFARVFHVLAGVTYAALLVVTARLLRVLGRPAWPVLLLCLPAQLYFGLNRFDVLPALLVSAAVLAAFRSRPGLSGVLLAGSVFVKLYTVLFIPLLFVYLFRRNRAAAKRFAAAALLTMAATLLITLFLGGLNAFFPLFFHGNRQIEVASYLALPTLMLQAVGAGSWVVPFMTLLAQLGTLTAALGVTFKAVKRTIFESEGLIRSITTLALLLTIVAPFTSPQWILWLVPLLVLLPLKRFAVVSLIIGLDLATYLLFPVSFDLIGLSGAAWLPATAVRLAFSVSILWWLWRLPSSAEARSLRNEYAPVTRS